MVTNLVLVTVIFHLLMFNNNVQCNYESLIKNIKIFYYTELYGTSEIDITREPLPHNFNTELPIKLLVHGWNANRNQVALLPVMQAYRRRNDTNMLVAEWIQIAHLPYPLATQMVSATGTQLGLILKELLLRTNISVDQVHVIGHSLGAHIAGHVGRYFQGEIRRITGLDPAGPLFNKFSKDALRKEDAKFVDVMHTDPKVLGEFNTRGHIDFYPNGGPDSQPGCEFEDLFLIHACSHYRAPLLFAESILRINAFNAYRCSLEEITWNSVESCLERAEDPTFMGEELDQFNASTYPNIFYLETNNMSPYGIVETTFA